MIYTRVRLSKPVKATVISSFGSFKENEQVTINRVAGGAQMFGVSGQQNFLPSSYVDETAREEILRQFRDRDREES